MKSKKSGDGPANGNSNINGLPHAARMTDRLTHRLVVQCPIIIILLFYWEVRNTDEKGCQVCPVEEAAKEKKEKAGSQGQRGISTWRGGAHTKWRMGGLLNPWAPIGFWQLPHPFLAILGFYSNYGQLPTEAPPTHR